MIEMSELKQDVVYSMASAVKEKRELTGEEKEYAQVIDVWAKKVGETGSDPHNEIAAFIQKTLEPVLYNAPDELLDQLFERGSIGEFDDYMATINPKNTLEVYDAAKGGNVPKSYIDYTTLAPKWFNKQIETSISYADLRKNGWRSVANLITFAEEALKNKMFFQILDVVNSTITSGMTGQYIANGSTTLAGASMDALSLYLLDHVEAGATPVTISLSKYAQAIAKMAGYNSYMSDSMKDEFNKYGLVNFYQGVKIGGISSAIVVNGQTVVPDKVVFGFAGKIGKLDTRGEVRVYQNFDNNKEQINIKITGFEFGYCIEKPENMAKVVVTA